MLWTYPTVPAPRCTGVRCVVANCRLAGAGSGPLNAPLHAVASSKHPPGRSRRFDRQERCGDRR